jgi:tetratricopeptide (TPR) repeat protein
MEKENEELAEARFLSLSGNYKEALQRIEMYLLKWPDNVDALLLEGNVLELGAYACSEIEDLSFENCDDLARSKSCYESILAKDPNHAAALCDLAGLYKSAKRYAESLDLWRRAEVVLLSGGQSSADALQEVRDEISELH